MMLFEQGLAYWRIAKRFHEHRQFQGMRPVAVNDMQNLLPTVQSGAVKRRIHTFITNHSKVTK